MRTCHVKLLIACLLISQISFAQKSVSLRDALKKVTETFGTQLVFDKQIVEGKNTSYNVENMKGKQVEDVLKGILYPNNLVFLYVSPNYYTIIAKNRVTDNQTASGSSDEQNNAGSISSTNKIRITGSVTDSLGKGVPGATVTEVGHKNSTLTNVDGTFAMNVANPQSRLFVSSIGYASKETVVGNQTTLSIVLQQINGALGEVVVVGYGTQKSSNISGAVSTVSTKKIAQNPSPNLSNSLVGQTAGIIATQRSGEPGNDASNIFIRGIGTTGDNSPIFVIDGIVRSSSDFAQLNPNEIQSFSVLKDAASAAVFGVRGGNGVILVTTKRGVAGKMQIDYSANFGVQQRTRVAQFLNSYDLASLYNEALANEGKPALYPDSVLQKYKDGSDPDAYPNSDWNSILKNTAMMNSHSLSATGGSDKIRYAALLSYLDQDGIVHSNNFKRYNFRSNIDADVTNTTRFSFDLAGRNEKVVNIFSSELFRSIVGTPTNRYPTQYSNGYYAGGPSYAALPENGNRNTNIQSFRGRMQLVQQVPFIDGLSVKAIAAYDKTFTDIKNWYFPVVPFYTRLPDGTFRQEPLGKSSLYQDHYDDQSITLEAHANYEKKIGNNRLNALVLYTQTKQTWNDLNAYREQYSININEINFGPAANRNNGGYSGTSGRQGVVGRINFSHNDKYSLETSFRADGSEQFAKGKRWGFFPSVSGAYNISQENFMKAVKFVNYLKLRGSYGILGNDRLSNARFLYLQSYNVNGNAVFGNGNVEQSITEGTLANPNVTWETIKKLDIGLDARLLNGMLTATVDYFYDKRSNILGYRNASVPSILGIGLPVENIAKVDNRGFKLTLGHQNTINRNLRYNVSGNITFARNKIIFIDEPAATNADIRRTGRPLGTEFGLQAIGIFQTAEEVAKSATQLGNTGPGDIKYKDVNNDGVIDDNDRIPIGKANTPEIIYGFNGGLVIKNFKLSFLFQGAANVNQWYRGEGEWPFFVGAGALKTSLNRWTPSNPNASDPRVLINVDNLNHANNSSFWLKNAAYLRLKSLEAAYNLPKEMLGKTKFIQGLRLYVNCNNVYTWTKIKNFDPENGSDRGWAYPQLRIFNAGFNVTF